jgi:hypothetical protein
MAEGPDEEGFLIPTLRCVADWLNDYWLMHWLGCIFPSLKAPKPADTERYVLWWFVGALAISVAVCSTYKYDAPGHPVSHIVALLIYSVAALRVPEVIVRARWPQPMLSASSRKSGNLSVRLW